jgi:hypothetical protein
VIDRSFAIFSGISTRVVDRLVPQLGANGVDCSFVKFNNDYLDADYYDRLAAQTVIIISRALERKPVTLSGVLVSCVQVQSSIDLEVATFFPAFRRLSINAEWRNNPDAAGRIAASILAHFQSSAEKDFLRSVSVRRDARFLLPVRNTRCKSLVDQFRQIYAMRSYALSNRVNREVVSLRGRRAYRVNGIDFQPVINNEKHPVRRTSDTTRCNLAASFRFGALVPQRLEFDVTCENGLRKKSFSHCDGTLEMITVEASHINMRANDDFEYG